MQVRSLDHDADGAVTLPTIKSDEIGATYTFFIGTDATDLDIKTDGTDKYVGSIVLGVNNGTIKAFKPAATNDVIEMVAPQVVTRTRMFRLPRLLPQNTWFKAYLLVLARLLLHSLIANRAVMAGTIVANSHLNRHLLGGRSRLKSLWSRRQHQVVLRLWSETAAYLGRLC